MYDNSLLPIQSTT